MRVTFEQLEQLGACEDHLVLFAAMWGRSVEVTPQACAEAAALELDANCAARRLLPQALYAAYHAQCKPFWDAYWAQCKPFRDACEAQSKLLREAYVVQCWQIFASLACPERGEG